MNIYAIVHFQVLRKEKNLNIDKKKLI